MQYLLATSLDGYLGVWDLRVNSTSKTSLLALSDCMEEDLTSICLMKGGKFVCVSTSEGNILIFKWDYFGDFKDRVVGHPNSIDTMVIPYITIYVDQNRRR
jgi:WD40 repeat protein